MTSMREMYQLVKDCIEISNKGEDFRKYCKTRSMIALTVTNSDGIIKSHKEIPKKSHVKGLMAHIYAHQVNILFTGVYNTAGGNANTVLGGFKVETTIADSSLGIQVGSGNAGVKLTDFKLDTLITHGTGTTPGQLEYSATTFSSLTNSATGVWSFTFERDFLNNTGLDPTGVSVDVKETDFVVKGSSGSSFLGERSLTGTIALSNDSGDPDHFKDSLKITYKEQVQV